MKQQAKKLYDHNKTYVEAHSDSMNWKQLLAFCNKQDALYKMFNGIEDK